MTATYSYAYVSGLGKIEGIGINGDIAIRLTDQFFLKANGLLSHHPIRYLDRQRRDVSDTMSFLFGGLGIGYLLDVIPRISPMIDAQCGLFVTKYPRSTQYDLGFRLGLSLDYWLTHRISLGIQGHYFAVASTLDTLPIYVAIGPRVGIAW